MTKGAITVHRRRMELEGFSPIHQAELESALTEADVATLRHLADRGMGSNTLRAISSDLAYLEAWSMAVVGTALPWPAPLDLVLKFIAHHLWDPEERARNPVHGMPRQVAAVLRAMGHLRSTGPHAPSTVKRRLSSWSTLHGWRDVEGPFNSPALRKALRLAVRAHTGQRQRKSPVAVTLSVLEPLLADLDTRIASADDRDLLVLLRDRALLSLAFSSGGRRRSEIASLMLPQVEKEITAHGQQAVRLHLGRTKTTDAAQGLSVLVVGRGAVDLEAWLVAGRIGIGAVFRRIDRWGHVGTEPLSAQSVNLVLKRRVAEAGGDPTRVSAHGLRSGFMTEACLAGVSLPEAMRQSGHRSVQMAAHYFDLAEADESHAARLLP